MVQIKLRPLTPIENFSAAKLLTAKMVELNNDQKNSKLAKIKAISLCTLVIFAALSDVFIHLTLTFGKSVSSLAALPFRCCVRITPDLELASPLIHLIQTIRSLSNTILLPILCFLDSVRAHHVTQINHSQVNLPEASNKQNSETQKEIDEIKAQNKELSKNFDQWKKDYSHSNLEFADLNKSLQEAKTHEPELKKLKEEVSNLESKKQKLEERIKEIKKDLPPDTLEIAKICIRTEMEGEVQTLKQNHHKLLLEKDQKIGKLEDELLETKQKLLETEKKMNDITIEKARLALQIQEQSKKFNKELNDLRDYMNLPGPGRLPKVTVNPPSISDEDLKIVENQIQEDKEQKNFSEGLENLLNQAPDDPPAIDDTQNAPATEADIKKKEDQEVKRLTKEAKKSLDQLNENIKKFRISQNAVNIKDVKLDPKHAARVHNLFQSGGVQGLRVINRYLKNLKEFCENKLSMIEGDNEKNEPLLTDSMMQRDMTESVMVFAKESFGKDFISSLAINNSKENLYEFMRYIENYLEHIKAPLAHLVAMQKKSREEDEQYQIKKQAKDAKDAIKKKQIEIEKLKKPITLHSGSVQVYDNELPQMINVEDDLKSGFYQNVVALKFKSLDPPSIKDFNHFQQKLRALHEAIESGRPYLESEYKNMVNLVDYFNKQTYRGEALRIVKP